MHKKLISLEEQQRIIKSLEAAKVRPAKIRKTIQNLDSGNIRLAGELLNVITLAAGKKVNIISQVDRTLVHELGLLHQTTGALVFSPDKKLILQRRPHNKTSPKDLTSYGGHMGLLTDYLKGAKLEIKEELLNISPECIDNYQLEGKLRFLRFEQVNFPKNKELRAQYIYQVSVDEYEKIISYKEFLNNKKASLSKNDFENWLEQESHKKGYGEIWDIIIIPLNSILNQKFMILSETYRDGEISEKAFFTPDNLRPMLFDQKLITKINNFINGK